MDFYFHVSTISFVLFFCIVFGISYIASRKSYFYIMEIYNILSLIPFVFLLLAVINLVFSFFAADHKLFLLISFICFLIFFLIFSSFVIYQYNVINNFKSKRFLKKFKNTEFKNIFIYVDFVENRIILNYADVNCNFFDEKNKIIFENFLKTQKIYYKTIIYFEDRVDLYTKK